MPIITVKYIEGLVATPEQKKELIAKMTDTFVSVVGEIARPLVYCLLEETPRYEWGIAGVPMPDLRFLISDKYAGIFNVSSDIMKELIAKEDAALAPKEGDSQGPDSPSQG